MAPALIGPAAFFGASIVGARKVRGYRHRDEPMSALAAKGCESAPMMIGGFLTLGASTIMLARAVRGAALPRPVVAMLEVSGAAIVAAGVGRQSDRSCPVRFLGDEVTLSDDVHLFSSMVVFASWLAMPLLTAAFGRRLRPVDRRRSLALGVTAVAGWTWGSVLIRGDSERWGGVAQRVTVASALVWYPVAAIAATR
ncbi:MAG TPA: DUF998 domain-containing protein [Acidimicrobiia bacterium]